jgi:hypothetical protein
MSQAFVAKQGEQVSEAYFSKPAFGLFHDLPRLLSHLFGQLQGYGLVLSGMHFQSAEGHLGETHLHCVLTGSVIRVFLDRVEVSSPLDQGSAGHDRRAGHVLDAVRTLFPEIVVTTCVSLLNLHGPLPGARLDEALSGLTSVAPKSPGPLLLAGAVFYYGPDAGRSSSSLTLEPSTLVQEGLFLQARVLYDAATLEMGGLSATSLRYVRDALSELGLTLEGFR